MYFLKIMLLQVLLEEMGVKCVFLGCRLETTVFDLSLNMYLHSQVYEFQVLLTCVEMTKHEVTMKS